MLRWSVFVIVFVFAFVFQDILRNPRKRICIPGAAAVWEIAAATLAPRQMLRYNPGSEAEDLCFPFSLVLDNCIHDSSKGDSSTESGGGGEGKVYARSCLHRQVLKIDNYHG